MIKRLAILLVAFFFTAAVSGCSKEKKIKNITVSAAISLKEPMEDIAAKFERDTHINVNLNYGGSGVLQRQIEEGAPVDIFISAGKDQMERLQSKQLVDSSTRVDLLGNELVLVSPNTSEGIKSLEELGSKNVALAIGEVNTVPAGEYAKESLERLRLWGKVKPNVIYGRDVKDVLKYVQKGEVQAGIVYESDTVSLDKNYIVIKIPDDVHKPIIYTAAVVAGSKDTKGSKAFLEYMRKVESRTIFMKYKFKVKE